MKAKEFVYYEITIRAGLRRKDSQEVYCSVESVSYDTAIPQKEMDIIRSAAKDAIKQTVRKTGKDITLKLEVPLIVKKSV